MTRRHTQRMVNKTTVHLHRLPFYKEASFYASLGALVIAGLSLYYTFFHQVTRIALTPVSCTFEKTIPAGVSYQLDFLVSNAGNSDAILLDCRLIAPDAKHSRPNDTSAVLLRPADLSRHLLEGYFAFDGGTSGQFDCYLNTVLINHEGEKLVERIHFGQFVFVDGSYDHFNREYQDKIIIE